MEQEMMARMGIEKWKKNYWKGVSILFLDMGIEGEVDMLKA